MPKLRLKNLVFGKAAGRYTSVLGKRQTRIRVHPQLMPKEGSAEPGNPEWIVRPPAFPHTVAEAQSDRI